MKRLIISVLITVLFAILLGGCAASKKNHNELRGLMLLDNLQMPRNKAFHSRHNMKLKNDAYRRYRKNSRNI